MRLKYSILLLLAAIQILPATPPNEQEKIDSFKASLCAALTAKNIEALTKCFYWGETPKAVREEAIHEFEVMLKDHDLSSAYILSADDQKLNQGWVRQVMGGRFMNGLNYNYNLKPEWMCMISLKEAKGSSGKLVYKMFPVGISPDGTYKFPGTDAKNKETYGD